ncbi:MAG: kinase/pyrophosphorylase [Anaerolineae bacterium]|jgi:regulator of PEP synthase PpsR (kinase-PPPase family)|nr:kinase/pyrophosphorylase [Anaerolineae bacterium]
MSSPPIYIVSGGMGTSGEHLVQTALAQFHKNDLPLIIVSHVDRIEQLQDVVAQAEASGGIIVHTLVDATLRDDLIALTQSHNVVSLDLIGPLLRQLTRLLGEKPLGQPGLYRQLREDYFKRMEAIEFTVAHDDGRKPHEWHKAEIVLTGVSRAGKTPLSMYLSTLGWKVANVPLIQEVAIPEELFEIDARRVVGLDIDPDQLVTYRRRRQQGLGVVGKLPYADPQVVYAEVEFARQVFRRGQFAVIDITDKSIEESANEAIATIRRRLG